MDKKDNKKTSRTPDNEKPSRRPDTKTADELLLSLKNSRNLSGFLTEYDSSFHKDSVGKCLYWKIMEHDVSKSDVAKGAGINYIYLYQILAGLRKPSRDRVICIGLGIGCSFDEMQVLLRDCGYAELNVFFRRDSIIIYGFLHGEDVFTINDHLYDEQEETLF